MSLSTVVLETKPNKKLMAIVFIYDPRLDPKDTQGLQKSELYDYTKGPHIFLVSTDSTFGSKLRPGTSIDGFILEIPNHITSDQFSTLRQAEALGSVILTEKTSLSSTGGLLFSR
jgi:hypothetical protein